MSSRIVVQGESAAAAQQASYLLRRPDALVRVDTGRATSARTAAGARSVAPTSVSLGEYSDQALVELQLDQGVLVWMSVGELRESALFNQSATPNLIEVGPALRATPGESAVGEWVVKALTVVEKPVSKLAHAALVDAIEARLGSAPGLYRIAPEPRAPLQPVGKLAGSDADAPYLLFLHGTASSTQGSFGDLWQANGGAAFAELARRYAPGRILALQHGSLRATPIDNALAVAEAMPAGAVLHLVSHSRGGLIGELLARANARGGTPFGDDERARFRAALAQAVADGNASWDGEADKLDRLNTVLAAKRLRVERFARVACPALGTTLASGKLQTWFNIVMNVASAAGTLAGAGTLAAVADLLKGLIGGLIDFEDLPGLTAMDPRHPLIHLLNADVTDTSADLAIIGGVTLGSGVWNRLKMLLVDAFFAGDNDLVVDTPSMSGGTRREHGALRFVLPSADINHFQYFAHPQTARHVLDALAPGDRSGKGFDAIVIRHALRGAGAARRIAAPAPTRPPIVFVLPGLMGSDLDVDGERVWVDCLDLFAHGLRRLEVDAAGVVPVGLDDDTYAGLIEFLGATHEVIPFAYDWRLALDDAGKRLNDALRATLARIDPAQQPIRLVAHSTGGLVVRAMMLREDSVWPELARHDGARILMLGTPNLGSHAIANLLLGRENVLRKLALVHDMHRLLAVIGSYRGVLDLLPWQAERDYFDADTWTQLMTSAMPRDDVSHVSRTPGATRTTANAPVPDAHALRASRAFCARLAAQSLEGQRVFYVAGKAEQTLVRIDLEKHAGSATLNYLYTTAGDGRVPWSTGIPSGVPTWYVDAVHGDIPALRNAYPGFLDILQSGRTRAFASERPELARAAANLFEAREAPVSYLPDADAIRRAAIGRASPPSATDTAKAAVIPVRVSWGDLRYAAHAVMVGHYAGDTIVSAEAALDAQLGGELRRRHQLGVYPGRLGSALAVDAPDCQPRGAIVIGLGDVGGLSAGHLSRAVANGLLAWLAERSRASAGAVALEPVGLSLLLIGSGGAGLSVATSINAILRGVAAAQDRARSVVPGVTLLTDMEFVELFEDRAHSLWHDLGDLIEATDLGQVFERRGGLALLPNARRRVRMDEAPDWWQRLQITREGERLLFNDMVARARSELRVLPTQGELIERLIAEATASTVRDIDLETTLFELLVPNELKDTAPRRDNLLLVLDAATARYPWELMTDTQDTLRRPQSIATGSIRQFVTATFRDNPAIVSDDSALVIGDPRGPYVELPGAQREAAAVIELLDGAAFKVTSLNDRPKTSAVLRALYAKPYRVLHLAGHGVSDTRVPAGTAPRPCRCGTSSAADAQAQPCRCEAAHEIVSGMVLEDGSFLTHAEIGQMRNVPEFVFVNCCHLGRIGAEESRSRMPERVRRTDMAAQFGEQFISIGVRAIIAAGWAVDDAAGEYFARELYGQMLHGTPFGEAVKRARERCFKNFPTVNTWGAYQCYGDPDYRLVAHRTTSVQTHFASERELVVEGIERAAARYTGAENRAAIADQLEHLRRHAFDHGFAVSGVVHEAIGHAYERMDLYAEAIRSYRDAAATDNGHPSVASLGALVRISDLRARLRIEELDETIWDAAGTAAAKTRATAAAKRIRTAIAEDESLLLFGRTRERLAAVGRGYQRLALVVGGAQRAQALARMAAHYQEAAAAAGNDADPYPLLQLVTARIVLEVLAGRRGPAKARRGQGSPESKTARVPSIGALLDSAAQLIERLRLVGRRGPWTDAMSADLMLAAQIHAGTLDDGAVKSIVASYRDAIERARDSGAAESIHEQVGFLYAMLAGDTSKKARATREHLARIRAALAP